MICLANAHQEGRASFFKKVVHGALCIKQAAKQKDAEITTRPVCEALMEELAQCCETKLMDMACLLNTQWALVMELPEQVRQLTASDRVTEDDIQTNSLGRQGCASSPSSLATSSAST